ncbi:B2 protein [Trifolium repens]|nr:B2 protein [Trifolium repens]
MHVQPEIVAAHEFEEKGAFYALDFLLSRSLYFLWFLFCGLWFMVAREKRAGNLKNGAVGYREELKYKIPFCSFSKSLIFFNHIFNPISVSCFLHNFGIPSFCSEGTPIVSTNKNSCKITKILSHFFLIQIVSIFFVPSSGKNSLLHHYDGPNTRLELSVPETLDLMDLCEQAGSAA